MLALPVQKRIQMGILLGFQEATTQTFNCSPSCVFGDVQLLQNAPRVQLRHNARLVNRVLGTNQEMPFGQ